MNIKVAAFTVSEKPNNIKVQLTTVALQNIFKIHLDGEKIITLKQLIIKIVMILDFKTPLISINVIKSLHMKIMDP